MGRRIRGIVLILVLSGVGVLVVSSLSRRGGETAQTGPGSGVQPVHDRVRVEVLNGGGVAGAAWDATQALRDSGFDVVGFGNAGTYSDDSSVVMDRVGDLETARRAADALGITQVVSEPDSTLFVDVTVRLGPDWPELGPTLIEDEETRWWDLRRFFRRGETPEPEDPRGP